MLPKTKKDKIIYLDHAASTPVDKRVFLAMEPYFMDIYGNPSSLHTQGTRASKALEKSRLQVAQSLGSHSKEIVFTGSGTESDNLALYGIIRAHMSHGKHIITTAIEHDAVLKPIEDLKNHGFEVTYIQPDQQGLIRVKDIITAIRPDTVLISIMYANNEIGAIAPIAEIGREILRYRKSNNSIYPLMHTDACQAAGYLDLSVDKLHVDAMTINGSKIYGPKGVGVLYLRNGVALGSIIKGGGQERQRRSGTENIPGIVGLATALQLAQKQKDKEVKRMQNLSSYFWQKIQKTIPDVILNGPEIGKNRLCNNLNINFKGLEGDALLLYLNEYGIMCSVGSACSTKTMETSHVLRALGLGYQEAQGSIRFSLGRQTTKQEIDYVMKHLPAVVAQVRAMQKTK